MVLDRKQKGIVLASLIVYFLVIVWVIMFKMGLVPLEEFSARGPYFIPFQFVYNIYLENNLHLLPRQIIVMIVNFLMFIPFGMGIGVLTTNKTLRVILALVLGSCFEITQFILHFGVFDMWDIILNMVGVFYGYEVIKVYQTKFNVEKTIKVLKVLIVIGIFVFIFGMAFAIYRLF